MKRMPIGARKSYTTGLKSRKPVTIAISATRLMTFVTIFGAMGAALLLATHAATGTNAVSLSPQSGTISGNASVVSDSTAIGGQATEFGSSSSGGSTGGASTGSGGTTSTTAGCNVSGVVAPCTSGSNSGTGTSGWGTPIFDDEFNGSSLDTTKWSTGWFGSGITGGISSSEDDCYDPAQVVVSGGELDLNLIAKKETCDGSTKNNATGFITSDGTFQYTYGFVEARMWLPGSGSITDWPSFWQDGQNWPADGELDVLEGLSGEACAHWHGPTGNGDGYGPGGGSGCAKGNWAGGWHTFAADWEQGKVTWYYDGTSIGCVESTGSDCGSSSNDSTITGSPQYLILGMGVGSPEITPATQKIDYVRVWQK